MQKQEQRILILTECVVSKQLYPSTCYCRLMTCLGGITKINLKTKAIHKCWGLLKRNKKEKYYDNTFGII